MTWALLDYGAAVLLSGRFVERQCPPGAPAWVRWIVVALGPVVIGYAVFVAIVALLTDAETRRYVFGKDEP